MNRIFSLKVSLSATAIMLLALGIGLAQKPELVMQAGHSNGVMSIAYSPDGRILASGSQDKTIKLWEVATGVVLRTLKGHSEMILSVAFSPDGKTVASGSGDRTIRMWNITNGVVLRTFNAHSAEVSSVAFSSDGIILASGSKDTVRLWNVTTGAELRTLTGPGSVKSVAFSRDGKTLACGGWDKTVRLWDVSTGGVLHTFRGEGFIRSIAFSPDGKTLASAEDETVKLWDVSTGLELRKLVGHASSVFSVAFSPDGKTLASASEDKMVKLWDLSRGRELHTLKRHRSSVFSVAFSPDGRFLASGSYDCTIELWDTSSGSPRRTLKGTESVSSVAVGRDRTILASAQNETVKLWDLSTNAELRTLKSHFGPINSVAFSPDGKILASAGGHTIRLWDVSTGADLRTLKGHSENVFSIAFTPDGHKLASASQDKTVKVWDVSTGTELRTLNAHSFYVTSVVFSPDTGRLASGSWDDMIKLWDVSSGEESLSFEAPEFVNCVAWASNEKTLASGGFDKAITIWDIPTGGRLRTLTGHSGDVTSIAFSVDSKTLASASSDNKIKLWQALTGKELKTFAGHSSAVTSVVFGRKDEVLISGSEDSSIKIWEINSGKELASLIALDEDDWIVITPDGLFDGSPAAWNQILWRFNNNTFDHAPVEAFFNEFYYPGLLADIFAGKRPKAPADISTKDRRQPRLEITTGPPEASSGKEATMPLSSSNSSDATAKELSEMLWKTQLGMGPLPMRSLTAKVRVMDAPAGAHDVRLFRNGSLVKVWHGDVLKGQTGITLETTVPIVSGPNNFTAYAFNHDNIKSTDATLTVTGADSLKRKGKLHILAVGVSQYANREYNLNYTTDDATAFASQLKLRQDKLGQYQSVEIKTLLNENATKANILAELKKLAANAQPEDAVVVYFSGHGKADGDRFYLVPHDLGYTGSRDQLSAEGLKTIVTHSISDQELEEAFRGIDAGQMFMIIDACNSGQALENKDEPRRGPMNTRGLAQLAYEKGMYILTASQNVEEAFVSMKLKHSYLTYALVEEGLKTKVADADRNGEVVLREWFDYALARVPKLREEVLQTKSLEEVTPKMKAARSQKSQTPRVFYRREAEARPLIVANVGASK